MTKKIALIDGYGFVFRAYHSLPPLTRKDGTPVGAVYGFTNMLIKLLAGLNVSHALVVFDAGSKTFRNDLYPKYKANRPPCPEDLKPQFPIVREAAEALNYHIIEKPGFEADDIIATVAKQATSEGFEVMIVSSDKDLMQLIDDNVFMYDAMRTRLIKEPQVQEKFMVKPGQVIDILSLIGDSSDNVPGVKGIGPKTAAELLNEFGNLENIFANLDKIKQEKRRQMLIDGESNAKLSKQLITLKHDVDLGINLEDLTVKDLDPYRLLAFLDNQGFKSLMTRVQKEFGIEDNATRATAQKEGMPVANSTPIEKIVFDKIKKTAISKPEVFEEIRKKAQANGIITIDYHFSASGLDFITFATAKAGELPEEIFYLEIFPQNSSNKNASPDLFDFEPQNVQAQTNQWFSLVCLEKILLDRSIKKVFFDAKKFLKLAAVKSYEDVSLINYLLNSASKNNLRELIDINLDDNIEERGFGKIFAQLEKNNEQNLTEIFSTPSKDEKEKSVDKTDFFAFRNFAIYQLYQIFLPKIFELKLYEAYLVYELPLLEVIAQMECEGIKIDVEKLHFLSIEFGKKIKQLSSEIYALAGCEFNIASTQQLSEILFNKLGLASGKKSKKTGALSTGHAILEELEEEGHEIAKKILNFRKFSKLKSTYTDSLVKEINPKTGRIHTSFSTISTVTGRFSSNAPNLQNIPVKTEEGRQIRRSFIAKKDHLFVSADYSQIELRVLAHMAKIDNLILAFKQDKDIHRLTASEVFKIPLEQVEDQIRSKAKAINFGIIYGISAFGLAKQLGISRQEAGEYINSYLHSYPGIDAYMRQQIEFARLHGYVETISGRKCFIRAINDKNPVIRAEAERLAINAPIQGSAADIVKKAMISLYYKLKEQNLPAKILLQIHDEIVVEVKESAVHMVSQLLTSEMRNAVILDAPLQVDLKIEKNWE